MTAVDLQGAYNVRDLGGLRTKDRRRTRYGLVYRGDSLDSITPADAKILFDKLGIGTIIDLRTPLDVTATPYAIPGSRWLVVEAIDQHEAELLQARDLVLYCA